MTIESTIAENTAAILKLTEVWAKLTDQAKNIKPGEKVTAGGKSPTPVEDTENVGAPAKGKASAASTASSKTAKESPAPATEGPTRDDVSKAIVSLAAKTDRATALAVLEPFGATSGKTVTDEDLAAVHEAVTAALAEAELG